MDANTLRETAQECRAYLESVRDKDWKTQVEFMELTVGRVVAHISQCLLWYSFDLSAGPAELSTIGTEILEDLSDAQLMDTLGTTSGMLAAVVGTAAPDARGWHPAGIADPSGYAAMGCDELLVHTADIAGALGVPFRPSARLAEATLRRLFPWAPDGLDPWQGLLWANDRIDLPDRPRPGPGWVWHCAPLSEWDGAVPVWAKGLAAASD